MARLLMQALSAGGHDVSLACRLRTRDGKGSSDRQQRLANLGNQAARLLLTRWQNQPQARPDLWFTYHLYYKAPDHIGPQIAEALKIPYVVAEASYAEKRANGPWATGHAALCRALDRANGIISLNPADAASLKHWQARTLLLPPFLHLPPAPSPSPPSDNHPPRLIAIGMMRPGDKEASFRLLAEALQPLLPFSWTLDLIGDGPARPGLEATFAPLGSRVNFRGALSAPDVTRALTQADLCLWPAVNEAYGMALLEAQAAGVPVVAGNFGGVSSIVADGVSGLLTRPWDISGFTAATRRLLEDVCLRRRMGEAARAKAETDHGFATASRRLCHFVEGLTA